MSSNPFGDQNPNPYQPGQFGAPPGGGSPALLSQANSAFNLGIAAIVVSVCCCGLIGLIMGVMSMNNAGGVLAVAPPGSEANSKASTAKTLGIVAIVIGGIKILLEIGGTAVNLMNQ